MPPADPAPIAAEEPTLAPEAVGPVNADGTSAAKTTGQIIEELGMPAEIKDKLSPLDCAEDVPPLLIDPVCFDGVWINSWDIDDPDFWNCGVRPLDIESPVCNAETGVWER